MNKTHSINSVKGLKSKPISISWKDNPRIDALLQAGIDRNNEKDVAGAIAAFQQAIYEAPDCSMAYWLLGGVHYYGEGNPIEALPFFKKAVELSPRTERASLALFHALWDLDRVDEAIKEIGRFQRLTNWTCQDYLDIVDEMHQKWIVDPAAKQKRKRSQKTIRA